MTKNESSTTVGSNELDLEAIETRIGAGGALMLSEARALVKRVREIEALDKEPALRAAKPFFDAYQRIEKRVRELETENARLRECPLPTTPCAHCDALSEEG